MHKYNIQWGCTSGIAYVSVHINYKLTYSHSILAKFTIKVNKWTVLKLLQHFEFLLSKTFLYTNHNCKLINYSRFKAINRKSNLKMLILIVKSFGSTNKGVDRVHTKHIIIKRKVR
jgi:hypothetical protein